MVRPEWTGDVVKNMHLYGLKQQDLAREMGVTPQWVSNVLNGSAEAHGSREVFTNAVAKLVARKILMRE